MRASYKTDLENQNQKVRQIALRFTSLGVVACIYCGIVGTLNPPHWNDNFFSGTQLPLGIGFLGMGIAIIGYLAALIKLVLLTETSKEPDDSKN